MVFHKRKYHTLHSKQQITLKHIDGLSAYQSMAPAACVAALNTALDNKCSCVCFAPPMQIMPYTHNTVSTVHIAVGTVKLDLEFIARSLRYSTYDRKRFAAITIRISNPKITALLFSSGKLVVTGAVSKQMAMNATRQIIGNLRRLYRLSRMSYSHHLIQNIVCNVCVPNIMTIDISRIYKDRNNLCTYQPKIFPGLIFRPSRSPIVLLIFKSSRIIVTDILTGFAEIFSVLESYFVPIHTVPALPAGEPAAAEAGAARPAPKPTANRASGAHAKAKELSDRAREKEPQA